MSKIVEKESRILGTFYQNPYFDDLICLLQADFPIPTKQTKDKEKIKEFKKRVLNIIADDEKKSTGEWPRKGKLLVAVSVSCPDKYYINKVDVDNILKLLFDILKKHAFIDDAQIHYVTADKHVREDKMIGFIVGIRELTDDENPMFDWPAFFSSNPDHWKDEREAKFGKDLN